MKIELEKECPCVKVECPRHGNCVACYANHKDKELPSTCRRPGITISPEHAARRDARLRAAGSI